MDILFHAQPAGNRKRNRNRKYLHSWLAKKKMIHTIKMKQNKKIAVAPRVILHPKYDDLHE